MKPNLIFLGKPGAGKGTQLQFMYDRGYKGISVGEVLRKMAKKNTPEGKKLKKIMKEGKLLPDDFVIKLLDKSIKRKTGLIFDGFPRTLKQAKALDKMLEKRRMKLHGVINIVASDKMIIERITGRFICSKCGATYNEVGNKTKVKGVCDVCKGKEFYKREDDKRNVIKARLKVYKDNVKSIIEYYKKQKIYYTASARKGIPSETDSNVEKVIEKINKKN